MLVVQDFWGDNNVKIDKNATNLRHLNTLVVPNFTLPNFGNFLNKSSGITCLNF